MTAKKSTTKAQSLDMATVGGVFARQILATLGGVAVGKGYIDGETATQLVGAVGTVAAVGWSLWQKSRAKAG